MSARWRHRLHRHPPAGAPRAGDGARRMTTIPTARVLVVDDEKLIRWSVAERLQRGGYDVVSAESGEQALEMLAGLPPDLMLLDVRLPGIDGVQTLQRALD